MFDTLKNMNQEDWAKIVRDRIGDLDAQEDPRSAKTMVADAIQVHPSQFSRMIRGKAAWTIDRCVMVMKYLDLSPIDVFKHDFPDIVRQEASVSDVDPLMLRVYEEFKRFRDPELMLTLLSKLNDIEANDPSAYRKLIHDIEYYRATIKDKPRNIGNKIKASAN